MVSARRLLRVEELQEAVAFDFHDKRWNANKIPDSDKMIRSCHGLVVRDTESGNVRLAHHTIQQYLTPSRENILHTDMEKFDELAPEVQFWPGLYKFRRDAKSAEVMAGRLCITYLSFSDFTTAVACKQDDKKHDLAAALQERGLVSIPAALGLGKHIRNLPYKYFGSHKEFKMPDIDYSKYFKIGPRDRRPSPDLRKKFALLEYVIEYWPSHTLSLRGPIESDTTREFWDIVQHKTLAFEFRPWGPNQHFGSYGCKGCPVPDSDDLEPKDLPSMSLVHWAAETGHLKVFDILEPPLEDYIKHERYHEETLLIACRHGQIAVVELLLARGVFDLSNSRAIVAACASGNVVILERLLQMDKSRLFHYHLGKVGAVALYQAASDGYEDIVKFLCASKVAVYVRDHGTGLTPLQIAAKNGHLQVLRVLCMVSLHTLPPGHSMDPPHEKTGMKALHYAAMSGHDEIIIFLARYENLLFIGSGLDDRDVLGETALIKSSKEGHSTVAKVLLEAGADPLIRGGEPRLPIVQTRPTGLDLPN